MNSITASPCIPHLGPADAQSGNVDSKVIVPTLAAIALNIFRQSGRAQSAGQDDAHHRRTVSQNRFFSLPGNRC